MTVIIKELVVKTGVVEHKPLPTEQDDMVLRNSIMKDCMLKLNRKVKRRRER